MVIWQRPLIMRTEFFSSYHWCWKERNYCETRNIVIVYAQRGFHSGKKHVYLAKYFVLLNDRALNE